MGYFVHFLNSDVILIDGDAEALEALANLLRGLEFENAAPIRLDDVSFATAFGGLELTAFPISNESGIRRVDTVQPHFSWHHSTDGWFEASEKIDQVAESGRDCHNWLESIGPEDARVMVSTGEYDFSWWQAQFGA
jgi:hypothetical protein